MTKKILTYIIILISIIGCSKPNEKSRQKNDLSERNLIGKIKSVKSELFDYSLKNDSLIIGDKINSYSFDRNEILQFNPSGLLISQIEYNSNDKVSNERKISYDEKNRLKEIIEIDHSGKKSEITYQYFYNDNDSLVRIEFTNSTFKRLMNFDRNEKNQLIKRTDKVKDTIQMTFTFSYDNNGNVIEENSYLKSDIPSKLISRKYDNNLLESENVRQFYDGSSSDTYKNLFEYDTEKRISQAKTNFYNENSYVLTINSYYNNSKLKEQTWEPIGTQKNYISKQKWDEKGNLIEHSKDDYQTGRKDVWIYKYKFDKVGNWISKESFKEKKPLDIVKREITYYE